MSTSPRSLWNGTVRIGRLAVPIKLHSAVQDKRVRFKQVHGKDLAPVESRRFCQLEGVEVAWEEVRRGLELEDGAVVLFEPEELSVLTKENEKTIDVSGFVDRGEVEVDVLDRAYFLGAREDTSAYSLIRSALLELDCAGIGEFTFHGRRQSTLLVAEDKEAVLRLYTLRPRDALVQNSSLEATKHPRRELAEREISAARKLVQQMDCGFDPGRFPDNHRLALLELIEAKAGGRKIEIKSEAPLPPPDDLLSALESSLDTTSREAARA